MIEVTGGMIIRNIQTLIQWQDIYRSVFQKDEMTVLTELWVLC